MAERIIAELFTQRANDREVVENWQKVCLDLQKPSKVLRIDSHFTFKGVENNHAISVDAEPIKGIIDEAGYAFHLLNMEITSNLQIRYSRNLTSQDAITDVIRIVAIEPCDPHLAIKSIHAVRTQFPTIDKQGLHSQLTASEKSTFIQRSTELHQLGEIARDFFVKLHSANEQAESSIKARLTELQNESVAERKRNKDEHDAQLAEIQKKKDEFDRAQKEFDTRNARYVRRFQRDELLKTLAIRGRLLTEKDAVTLSTITGSNPQEVMARASDSTTLFVWRRWVASVNLRFLAVFFAYLSLLAFLGYLIVALTPTSPVLAATTKAAAQVIAPNAAPEVASNIDLAYWVAVSRQIAASIAFFVTAAFFIKWLNWCFRQHSEKELHYVRLHDDFARANWLVETVSELKEQATNSELSEIIQVVGHGMFQDKSSEDVATSALEAIGDAIRGGSIEAGDLKINLPKGKKKKPPKSPPHP